MYARVLSLFVALSVCPRVPRSVVFFSVWYLLFYKFPRRDWHEKHNLKLSLGNTRRVINSGSVIFRSRLSFFSLLH